MLDMCKLRLLRWSPVLIILAAFAVWLEPTRVVWGWLRGEAFYQGRPTSYWGLEIERWKCFGGMGGGPTGRPWFEECYLYQPTKWESKLAWLVGMEKTISKRSWPTVLDGDPASAPVLRELANNPSLYVRAWAAEGLDRIQTGEKGPNVGRTGRNPKLTPAQVVRINS